MGDLLKDGLEFLRDSLLGHAASDVVYARGVASATIPAVYGRREYDVVGDGAITRFVVHDFIVDPTDLATVSGVVDPRRNDVITATIGGVEKVFQVLDINGVCFSKDSHGVTVRVHTKQVS